MNVAELFRRLSYGELSNISLGSEGIGEIECEKTNQIIHYTNEALLRLHSRFMLRESFLALRMHMHITNYNLSSRFASSNPAPQVGDTLYILDTVQKPFQDDLIKVMGVYDRFNVLYPLNDSGKLSSVFTPQPKVLQIPFPQDLQTVSVTYQAKHPLIAYENLEAEINVPDVLEGALTAYIAHLVYSFMNGQENMIKASDHLNRFETICNEVQLNDLVGTSISTTHSKLDDRGFV